ncbi:MAG: ABC transporter ATP-binding protein [Elusimicrobiota bacterium]|jgi:ABC-2 type transport system ATP-binding protein|nr:ABC transporter ATP-binding protein [Elusimicrobiota bacterium]
MPALGAEVKNIGKKMGGAAALRDVSLRFESGRVHGIIGPNGAGKTTLMRCLAGLLRTDGGEILYTLCGRPIARSLAKEITAYFPQEPSLYPDLSCMEHLLFFRDLYNINRADFETRSRELLAAAAMAPFADRPAGKLSGGMYKKLGLMCVLLNRPSLLLLDEPTIGVDPLSRRQLWDLIYKFAGAQMTVIIATSYMDEAAACAKVHALDEGRALAAGTPRELRARFRTDNFADIFLRSG